MPLLLHGRLLGLKDYAGLRVSLLRSPGAHPEPYTNLSDLNRIKAVSPRDDGVFGLTLTDEEIENLRQGRRKVIYLVLAVMRRRRPIHISGAMLLAKAQKLGVIEIQLGLNNSDAPGSDTTPPGSQEAPATSDSSDSNPSDSSDKEPNDMPTEEQFQQAKESTAELARDDMVLAEQESKGLQAALGPRMRAVRQRRRQRRGFVREQFLKNLRRRRARNGERFAAPDEDSDLQLAEAQEKGVDRIRGRARRGMRLHVTQRMLDELGIKLDAQGNYTLSEEELKALLEKLDVPPTSQRRRPQEPECKPGERAEASLIPPVPDAGEVDDALQETSLEEIYAALKSSVHRSLDTAAQPDVADIEQNLQKEVAVGPADTTAYYDYYAMTIAWENTWTAVYDELTEKQISDLYDEIVQVGGDELAKDVENTDYRDMREFFEDISGMANETSRLPGATAPPHLVGWIAGIGEVWPVLQPHERVVLTTWYNMRGMPFMGTRMRDQADNLVASARSRKVSDQPQWSFGRLGRVLEDIHERLYKEPYEFDVFVPNSYNFGLIQTYQQKWKPMNYQVGDLVSTLPLAPGEKKSYTLKKTVTTRSDRTSSQSKALSNSSERNSATKSQSDIVAKASMNAAASATMGASYGGDKIPFKINGTATASGSTSSESQKNRQDIRENTLKAAQEYKDEHSLEVVYSEETTSEYSETSEISNPNNEITVTYLFYELQRRFEVSSRLDKLTPVVMVAFEVPNPGEIDEDWLLTHDWVVRKALLDPSLAVALDYIKSGFTGDELAVEIFKRQWDTQASVVAQIRDNVALHQTTRDQARVALQDAAELVPNREGLFTKIHRALNAGPVEDLIDDATGRVTKADVEAAQESARLGMEWAATDLQDISAKLQGAIYALEKATVSYAEAVKHRQQMRTRIDQLRIHVKEHILHYMQAIWAEESADQRYFRLYDLEVLWPDGSGNPLISQAPQANAQSAQSLNGWWQFHHRFARASVIPNMQVELPAPTIKNSNKRPMHEVADIDNLLGFKGNYAVFPLLEHNALTHYLAQDGLDTYFGIDDPDGNGNLPTESEALEIAKCRWAEAKGDEDQEKEIIDWLTRVLANQHFVADDVVVPTGQLYIEALPGAHPLLEDFKLKHRAVDMLQANQALTNSRIETLRRVKRLLEEDLSDPEIDKTVHVTGVNASVNVDAD